MTDGEDEDEDEPDPVDQLLDCSNDPMRFVTLAFPGIKPEAWQAQVLSEIGERLHENVEQEKFKPIMIAVASGNAVGKTALLSWLILWAIAIFEQTLGVVTAGSEAQLRTRLWGELTKCGLTNCPTSCASNLR